MLDTLHAAYPDCAGQISPSVCSTPSANAGRRQPFKMIGSSTNVALSEPAAIEVNG